MRFGASRGMVASSPTAGNPLVSIRSTGSTAVEPWLKVMPDDAVYPPERSSADGWEVWGRDRLIWRRR